jgi:hypothetical protein
MSTFGEVKLSILISGMKTAKSVFIIIEYLDTVES